MSAAPVPAVLRKTPPTPASLRTRILLESGVADRTNSSACSLCNSCSAYVAKIGNDSIIVHHCSYLQGCKWCGVPALMQKLTPISFCKRSSCNKALFPRNLQSHYKAWFSHRACLAGWFHFTFKPTFAISDVTRVFLLLRDSQEYTKRLICLIFGQRDFSTGGVLFCYRQVMPQSRQLQKKVICTQPAPT